jgi:hypothetical protein
MDFGKTLMKEGWTIVTLSPNDAVEFNFETDSSIKKWLNENFENISGNQWQQVSYRKLAFRKSQWAILFKLSI